MTTSAFPSNLRSVFDAALNQYKRKTKNDLVAHQLTTQLENCSSPSDILALLDEQYHVQEFIRSQGDTEGSKQWLKATANVLFAFSAAVGEGVGLVFSPAKLIFAGIGVLLAAARDVGASRDALVDLFERIENFFMRLETYAEVPPSRAMMDLIVKILAEVLGILAIATNAVQQQPAKKYLLKLLGRTDIEDALKRLDDLTSDEALMATAQILKLVHSVDHRVRTVIDDGNEARDAARAAGVLVQQTASNTNEIRRCQLRESLRKWLSPPDPSTNHNIACGARQKGTAAWFFRGDIFSEWKSTPSLLWIHGKPGSGKSILSSAIIQVIEVICKGGQALMAYFFFDFRDSKKQSWHDLIISLLIQLSARSAPRCDILSRLYLAHDSGARQPSDKVLKKCLRRMLTLPDQLPVYLILDALDECPNTLGIPSPRERVLQLVKDFVAFENIHICATSRPEIDIREVLEPLTSLRVSLHDQRGQKTDIIKYVRSVVYSDSEPMMKRWKTEDKDFVVEMLTKRADGMFRWVFCQLQTLRHCIPPSVRRTLKELPESLDKTYERILREIKKPNRDHARRLLQCLVVAIRPLRVEELAEVLAIDFDDTDGIPRLNTKWRCEDQELALLSSCSSLITVVNTSHSRLVQFSHFSVKEFLTSPRLAALSRDVSCHYINLKSAHTIMAQACLGVLLRLGAQGEDDEDSARPFGYFPLARYAAKHWVSHAQFKDVSARLRKGMKSLFDPDKPHFAAWLRLHNMDTEYYVPLTLSMFTRFSGGSEAVPLYYAALYGFHDLAEHLISKYPQHVNARGGYHLTPLVAALAAGHFQTAHVLHRNGADMNVRGFFQNTPLHSAAFHGDLEMVQLFLEYNADITARNISGWTPLHAASENGHLDVVRLLIGHGVDPNTRMKNGSTPLHRASQNGRTEIVRVLLGYGVDVEAKDVMGRTAFRVASTEGHYDVMKWLLGDFAKYIS